MGKLQKNETASLKTKRTYQKTELKPNKLRVYHHT